MNLDSVRKIYQTPLLELVFQAASVHRLNFDPSYIQKATLISIKTGGCPENCSYCSQSQHNKSNVKPTKMMQLSDVVQAAYRAKQAGSSRFCMGAAWREVGNKHSFKNIIEMVRQIHYMDMEVCTTLGFLTLDQARQLKEAGLTAYNHNLDTSREFYPKIVSTRKYDDRIETIQNVQDAGLKVCSGGIIGLGESSEDRIALLHTLATSFEEPPESVPINALVPIPGTPLENNKVVDWHEVVRMVATARMIMPKSVIRLSAGRKEFTDAAQGLMFMAGANSIFSGDKLLTTENQNIYDDSKMLNMLGLHSD